MNKNIILKVLLGVALVALLAGCVQVFEEENKEAATDGGEVVIGALLPLSGEGAVYGLPTQRVLQIAAKNINDAGGIKGKKSNLNLKTADAVPIWRIKLLQA